MASDEFQLATPRAVVMIVTEAAFHAAEKLFQKRQLRQCALALLEAEHAMVSSGVADEEPRRDAGDMMCKAMGGLREDPWLMLGVADPTAAPPSSASSSAVVSDAALDRELKAAFRRLALKLHPDKNRALHTSDLFACLYASFEKVGTAAGRAAFQKEREDEAQ